MSHSLAIILAAGEGTRMKSDTPKILHKIANRSMLAHVMGAVAEAGIEKVCVVVAPDRPQVEAEARRILPDVTIVHQKERLGTAHAALQAREALGAGPEGVVVLFADTPLVRAETIKALLLKAKGSASVVALGFEAKDPTGYGRLLIENDQLTAIREHKDATEEQRRVTLCNGGLMALKGEHALSLLGGIGNANAQREYYLPDAVEIARGRGLPTSWLVTSEEEILGVNDRVQLAGAEAVMQKRLRDRHMRAGVTMIDPSSVFLSADTILGRDVIIEPNCWFGEGVSVADGVVIHGFSHLEGATLEKGVSIGPYARLRPGAVLREDSRIGNFVEVKATEIGKGSKANHLSYLGDSVIGPGANIGAGTITCNYDGYVKSKTVIGEGAFIGSNSALVAPVTIGARAIVAAGSTITANVADDELAFGRVRQTGKPDGAKALHEHGRAKKASKTKG